MLESHDMSTVIMNPLENLMQGTLMAKDYMPPELGAELIASKSVKAALNN